MGRQSKSGNHTPNRLVVAIAATIIGWQLDPRWVPHSGQRVVVTFEGGAPAPGSIEVVLSTTTTLAARPLWARIMGALGL